MPVRERPPGAFRHHLSRASWRLGKAAMLVAAGCALGCEGSARSEGETLYLRYGCATCHGPQGRGDGVLAASAKLKPTDLTDPNAYRRGLSEAAISETILEGVPGPGGGMPPYPQTAEQERLAIARFLRASSGAEGGGEKP